MQLNTTWCHFISNDATWGHLMPLDASRCHLMSLDATWCHLMPLDATWCHLMPLDATWCHLIPLNATWCHLMPLDVTWCLETLDFKEMKMHSFRYWMQQDKVDLVSMPIDFILKIEAVTWIFVSLVRRNLKISHWLPNFVNGKNAHTCTDLCKKNLVINVCLTNKSLKFGKDPCFRWGDLSFLITMLVLLLEISYSRL